jgi:hypothetical protein
MFNWIKNFFGFGSKPATQEEADEVIQEVFQSLSPKPGKPQDGTHNVARLEPEELERVMAQVEHDE